VKVTFLLKSTHRKRGCPGGEEGSESKINAYGSLPTEKNTRGRKEKGSVGNIRKRTVKKKNRTVPEQFTREREDQQLIKDGTHHQNWMCLSGKRGNERGKLRV